MVRRASIASALLLAALPALAQAQTRSWVNQCMPGAFQACASFSISLQYDATAKNHPIGLSSSGSTLVTEGFTRLTLGISNLQGVAGLPDPGAWFWRNATVYGMNTTWTTANDGVWFEQLAAKPFQSPGVVNRISAASPGGTPVSTLGAWEAAAYHGSGRSWIPGENIFQAYTLNWGGLYGCDYPVVTTAFWHTGCQTTVSVSYDLPGQWSFGNDTRIAWGGRSASGPMFSCTTGVDCRQEHAVPEPGSALLLATGLLGLAMIGRRRKETA